jgi:hypothetical protein
MLRDFFFSLMEMMALLYLVKDYEETIMLANSYLSFFI